MIIAIDGPSGSGKSTVSIRLAERLGFGYLDTGAIYRAIALHGGVQGLSLRITTDPSPARVWINEGEVSAQIRTPHVTSLVSHVAAQAEVRRWVTAFVQELLAQDLVVEGRDIGTVVAPDARLKVFLTADESVRSQRRAAEWGSETAVARDSIVTRDQIDSSREVAPLRRSPDAVVIDSSSKSVDQIVSEISALLEEQS